MLIRALVVLLLVLNLGVALWWALRPAVPMPEPDIAAGTARLQLVTEAQTDQAVAPQALTASARADVGPGQCFSFGPFDDRAAVEQAQARLQPRLVAAKTRRVVTGTPDNWQVLWPPLPDRDQARQAAKRLLAAGFKDHYVIGDGDQANAISLGLFGGESSARRHAANLVAAGFPVRVIPLGGGTAEYWLDAGVAAGAEFDPDDATAANRAESIDCARFDVGQGSAPPTGGQPIP